MNQGRQAPTRVAHVGYNTLGEAQAKGILDAGEPSLNVYFNPGRSFDLAWVFIPFGKVSQHRLLTAEILYEEWAFDRGTTITRIPRGITRALKAARHVARNVSRRDIQVIRANGPHLPSLVVQLSRMWHRAPTLLFIEAFWEFILPSQTYMPRALRAVLPAWYRLLYRRFSAYCGTPSIDPEFYEARGMDPHAVAGWSQEVDVVALLQASEAETLPNCVLEAGWPRLVSVGRLHPEKRPMDLIEVLVRTRIRFPNASLLLVGEGDSRDDILAEAQRLGVSDGVILTGAVTQAQGLRIVRASDVYVAPMQGNALVEALASGTPVVAYDHDTHRRLILDGHTGLLVTDGSPSEMARAVLRVLEDPSLHDALSSAASDWTLENLSGDNWRDRMVDGFRLAWQRGSHRSAPRR